MNSMYVCQGIHMRLDRFSHIRSIPSKNIDDRQTDILPSHEMFVETGEEFLTKRAKVLRKSSSTNLPLSNSSTARSEFSVSSFFSICSSLLLLSS
eukprot:UN03904